MKINRELDHLMELKQKLLLKLKAALVLDRIDLVKELSGELQIITEKERSLYNLNSATL